MTKQILSAIILFGLLSCNNSSNKDEGNEGPAFLDEKGYFSDMCDFVDTAILMSDEFEITQDNKIPIFIMYPGERFKLVGQLGLKLGETATVCGIITDGPDKCYGGGPNHIVQKINGESIQRFIQIPVSPYHFMEFGKHPLPKLENDNTYRFRVYETGEFKGTPDKAFSEAGWVFQECGFYFQNRLILISGKKISKLEWAPADFVGRNALLQGTAKNEKGIPIIIGSKWKLRLINASPWTKSEIGKQAEVYGKVQKIKGQDSYYVEDGQPGLVKLEDQLGKKVKLRGTAWSMNGYWWFNYRGTDLYVENMDKLPNWTGDNHGRPIEITGILEQAKLPVIDQFDRDDPEQKIYYIVRWLPIGELLTPELDYQSEMDGY